MCLACARLLGCSELKQPSGLWYGRWPMCSLPSVKRGERCFPLPAIKKKTGQNDFFLFNSHISCAREIVSFSLQLLPYRNDFLRQAPDIWCFSNVVSHISSATMSSHATTVTHQFNYCIQGAIVKVRTKWWRWQRSTPAITGGCVRIRAHCGLLCNIRTRHNTGLNDCYDRDAN